MRRTRKLTIAPVVAIAALAAFAAPAAQAVTPGLNGKVVFESNRDGNFEIYSMNADGSNLTRLTNNAAADQAASVSPDGTRVAFTSTRDGNPEIYVMSIDGSNLTRLTNNAALDSEASLVAGRLEDRVPDNA